VSSTGSDAYFGYSLAISGTLLAIGAYQGNSAQGAVYLFSCPTTSSCIQVVELVAPDGTSGDFFWDFCGDVRVAGRCWGG